MDVNIRKLRDSTAYWMKKDGPLSHIIISSRIRLARNIKNIPFPFRATDEQLLTVIEKVEKILKENKEFYGFQIIKLDNLSPVEIEFLVEKRLISFALARFSKPYRGILYNTDETMSIMINEEDHFRLQSMLPGFQLKKVWEIINYYDDKIEKEIKYAFNEKEGFLTCCPTNAGTGLRASVMLHLPGLIISNKISESINTIIKQGYAVRGFYGEGTEFQGNLFQISNQVTLGLSEEDIINRLEISIKQLIEKEQKAREKLIIQAKHKIEDQVMRSYGILTNAKIISTAEALNLLSYVRFGIEMGIIARIGYDVINRLMLIVQPGYLQLIKGQNMKKMQRDTVRAELIKEILD
ncbi:MAG: protein arginine kinase [Atribacterota bacterium]|nr:protein arginine kinase [Atribacterota bacterium]